MKLMEASILPRGTLKGSNGISYINVKYVLLSYTLSYKSMTRICGYEQRLSSYLFSCTHLITLLPYPCQRVGQLPSI